MNRRCTVNTLGRWNCIREVGEEASPREDVEIIKVRLCRVTIWRQNLRHYLLAVSIAAELFQSWFRKTIWDIQQLIVNARPWALAHCNITRAKFNRVTWDERCVNTTVIFFTETFHINPQLHLILSEMEEVIVSLNQHSIMEPKVRIVYSVKSLASVRATSSPLSNCARLIAPSSFSSCRW